MRIYLLIFFLFFVDIAYSQDMNIPIDSITIEKSDDVGNSFSFTFSYENFDTTEHDITKVREGLIDSSEFFGTDGSVPGRQIKDFILSIDGKGIEISKDIYSNFYNPNIGYVNGPMYLDAFFGKDSESVFVFMNGSDGAGAYSVVWNLRKDGSHSYSLMYDDLYFEFN